MQYQFTIRLKPQIVHKVFSIASFQRQLEGV